MEVISVPKETKSAGLEGGGGGKEKNVCLLVQRPGVFHQRLGFVLNGSIWGQALLSKRKTDLIYFSKRSH